MRAMRAHAPLARAPPHPTTRAAWWAASGSMLCTSAFLGAVMKIVRIRYTHSTKSEISPVTRQHARARGELARCGHRAVVKTLGSSGGAA